MVRISVLSLIFSSHVVCGGVFKHNYKEKNIGAHDEGMDLQLFLIVSLISVKINFFLCLYAKLLNSRAYFYLLLTARFKKKLKILHVRRS